MRPVLLSLFFFAPYFAHAITNGIDLRESDAPAVVLIENHNDDTAGTGVAITPNVILTAQHVVMGDAKKLVVNGNGSVVRVLTDEKFRFNVGEQPIEVALVETRDALPATLALIDEALPKGKVAVEFYGFGQAYDRKGEVDDRTVKRVGKNMIQWNEKMNTSLFLRIQSEIGPFDAKKVSGALPADSGGPMLWKNKVIGIASTSSFGIGNYINLQHPMVKKFLAAAAKKGWKLK